MDHYKETSETWNKIAELYQDTFMNLDLYDDTYEFFCKTITKQQPRILEIGCGPGNISRYLLNKRPDFQIEGIDVAPNMIALAKQNNPAARFNVMDCRDIDTLKPGYDGIMCGFCLPYLSPSDCTKLIQDCGSLLSANGILYLSFVEGSADQSGYQTGSSGDQLYFYYHDLEMLKAELAKQQFKEVNVYRKDYSKRDGSKEVHTIVIGMRK